MENRSANPKKLFQRYVRPFRPTLITGFTPLSLPPGEGPEWVLELRKKLAFWPENVFFQVMEWGLDPPEKFPFAFPRSENPFFAVGAWWAAIFQLEEFRERYIEKLYGLPVSDRLGDKYQNVNFRLGTAALLLWSDFDATQIYQNLLTRSAQSSDFGNRIKNWLSDCHYLSELKAKNQPPDLEKHHFVPRLLNFLQLSFDLRGGCEKTGFNAVRTYLRERLALETPPHFHIHSLDSPDISLPKKAGIISEIIESTPEAQVFRELEADIYFGLPGEWVNTAWEKIERSGLRSLPLYRQWALDLMLREPAWYARGQEIWQFAKQLQSRWDAMENSPTRRPAWVPVQPFTLWEMPLFG